MSLTTPLFGAGQTLGGTPFAGGTPFSSSSSSASGPQLSTIKLSPINYTFGGSGGATATNSAGGGISDMVKWGALALVGLGVLKYMRRR